MSNLSSIRNQRLESYRSREIQIEVYLDNGIKLKGKVLEFDEETLVLTGSHKHQIDGTMVERAKIATIQQASSAEEKRAPPFSNGIVPAAGPR